jgi:predicted unusual protein kinase regulating ubiquinone biosynthesis (AarF/ABC1/UbiB family)
MEWIDGIKITDKEKLLENKFDVKNIIQVLIEGFAEQIFITGFTHADPHPGNLLIRRKPTNSGNLSNNINNNAKNSTKSNNNDNSGAQ